MLAVDVARGRKHGREEHAIQWHLRIEEKMSTRDSRLQTMDIPAPAPPSTSEASAAAVLPQGLTRLFIGNIAPNASEKVRPLTPSPSPSVQLPSPPILPPPHHLITPGCVRRLREEDVSQAGREHAHRQNDRKDQGVSARDVLLHFRLVLVIGPCRFGFADVPQSEV